MIIHEIISILKLKKCNNSETIEMQFQQKRLFCKNYIFNSFMALFGQKFKRPKMEKKKRNRIEQNKQKKPFKSFVLAWFSSIFLHLKL